MELAAGFVVGVVFTIAGASGFILALTWGAERDYSDEGLP